MNNHSAKYAMRIQQLAFAIAVVLTCWLAMMTVHELGHIIGALVTGGKVTCVVLHPLSISRTDVFPNPNPAVVVWSGPVLGCMLPVVLMLATRSAAALLRNVARFFAGTCLIANGAYLLFGSFDQVGDCKQMLQTGSPLWLLIVFGLVAIPSGFALWHKVGSLAGFWKDPLAVTGKPALIAVGVCVATTLVLAAISGS